MVRVNIQMKNVDLFNRFRAKFPNEVNKSLDETAAFGKGLLMRSTAKGASGATAAAWDWIRSGNWVRRIFNPMKHAFFLETGTGLFGPLKRKIVSKSGGPLHWVSLTKTFSRGKRKGETVYRSKMSSKKGGFKETGIFAMSTKGMPAHPMVAPNKGEIQRDLTLRMRRTIKALWTTNKKG